MTDREIISLEGQRMELVDLLLHKEITNEQLKILHSLDKQLSGIDVKGCFFREFEKMNIMLTNLRLYIGEAKFDSLMGDSPRTGK